MKFSTVDQVDAWTEVAQALGYTVRYDHFGGVGGGVCEFGGSRVLFLDVSLSSVEQLEQLEKSIGADPLIGTVELPEAIAKKVQSSAKRAA